MKNILNQLGENPPHATLWKQWDWLNACDSNQINWIVCVIFIELLVSAILLSRKDATLSNANELCGQLIVFEKTSNHLSSVFHKDKEIINNSLIGNYWNPVFRIVYIWWSIGMAQFFVVKSPLDIIFRK